MAIFFRALRLLAMTVWVGGLFFFAFILAPLAFNSLPTHHEAGIVVGGTLHILNTVGTTCGFLFLIGTIALWFRTEPRGRRFLPVEFLLVLAMLIATAIVQHGIVPRMERDRVAAGGDIDAAAPNSLARANFERLHTFSEKTEGAVLLLGIANIVLVASERSTHQRAQAA